MHYVTIATSMVPPNRHFGRYVLIFFELAGLSVASEDSNSVPDGKLLQCNKSINCLGLMSLSTDCIIVYS